MQFKTNNKKSITECVTLRDAFLNTNSIGKQQVVLKTDMKYFSAYKSVWDKQGIKIDSLNSGDKLEITYYKNEWNGKLYNNFIRIKLVSKAVQAEDLMNKTIEEKQDESLEEIVDEITNDAIEVKEEPKVEPNEQNIDEIIDSLDI